MPKDNPETTTAGPRVTPTDNTAGPYYMTEEILQERAEKINPGRFKTQLYAGILASVSAVSFGTVLGWSSPAIRAAVDTDFQGDDPLNKDLDITWVASLGPLGCALGVPVWSYFNLKFGPRMTMLIQAPLLFITWAVIAYAEEDQMKLEMAMRFFCGLFAISYRICGETLLRDSVHRYYLRRMVVPYRACIALGILISYIMGYLVTDRFFAFLNCAIVLLHFVLLLLCPESPVYLYDKSNVKAENSLSWYRGSSNIFVEMRNIKKDSDTRKVDPAAYKYMLYSKVVMKAIAIIVMVNLAQVFSCYYIFLYYNPVVVKVLANLHVEFLKDFYISKSEDTISRNVDACILGLNMLVSCFCSTWVHYRVVFGVRKPLILSTSLVTAVLSAISLYLYFFENHWDFVEKDNSWIYHVLINLLVICYELGLSCCPDIMLMDYTPNQVFPRAKLIVKLFEWIFVFLLTKNFFLLSRNVHGSGTFSIFAFLSLCTCIGVCVFVVESKGKTLVQVQTKIGGNPIGSRGVYNKNLSLTDDKRFLVS